MKARGWVVVTTLGVALLTMMEAANAYLDPGTGSLIIQSIIGAIAAIGITAKLYWHKIKLMFSRSKSHDSEPGNNDQTD